jgi:TPR repeat protein
MCNVGYCYEHGLGTAQDYAKAVDWYTKAWKANSASGAIDLATMYIYGHGAAQNYGMAALRLKDANSIDPNNGVATNWLGLIYREGGHGVVKDDAAAFNWFQKSANSGYAEGMNNFGYCYDHALGVATGSDYAKAMNWYNKAVDAGSVDAMCNLGALYLAGYGVNKDYGKAMELYKKAAAAGNAAGMNAVGYMYANGYGVDKDQTQALDWYRMSADAGYSRAILNVARSYENGTGTDQDVDQARSWYQKAAVAGEAEAKTWLTAHPATRPATQPTN